MSVRSYIYMLQRAVVSTLRCVCLSLGLLVCVYRVSVDDLKAELMQLPRESNALSLVHLLNEIREEYVPRDAVCQIWRKLNSGLASICAPAGATSALKAAKRARSAAAIPIVRSRLLEV